MSIRRRLLHAGLLALAVMPCRVTGVGASPSARQAPAIELRSGHGVVALDSLRGKVVLVDFWASWCTPCEKSFPWLDAMQKRFAEQGLVVLGVSVDKSIDVADAFVAKHPISFRVAYDPVGKAAEAFGVMGMPSTYLIGRDGTIRVRHVGFDPKRTSTLEKAIEEALAP